MRQDLTLFNRRPAGTKWGDVLIDARTGNWCVVGDGGPLLCLDTRDMSKNPCPGQEAR